MPKPPSFNKPKCDSPAYSKFQQNELIPLPYNTMQISFVSSKWEAKLEAKEHKSVLISFRYGCHSCWPKEGRMTVQQVSNLTIVLSY
jgi:hypothetical protein